MTMTVLILDGWRPGPNKVGLDKLLHECAGLSLAEAKGEVDRLLAGEQVEIDFSSSEESECVLAAAELLGATESVAARPRSLDRRPPGRS